MSRQNDARRAANRLSRNLCAEGELKAFHAESHAARNETYRQSLENGREADRALQRDTNAMEPAFEHAAIEDARALPASRS